MKSFQVTVVIIGVGTLIAGLVIYCALFFFYFKSTLFLITCDVLRSAYPLGLCSKRIPWLGFLLNQLSNNQINHLYLLTHRRIRRRNSVLLGKVNVHIIKLQQYVRQRDLSFNNIDGFETRNVFYSRRISLLQQLVNRKLIFYRLLYALWNRER